MKKITISLAFTGLACLCFAQEKGIKFEQELSWTQIKKKAKAENKYIFVDVYATWCAPCKQMDNKVYTSEKLGHYMNDRFISVKVQADSSKDDHAEVRKWYPDAKVLLSKNHVNAYPSFLFFSSEGKLLTRDMGYKDENAMLHLAADAQDPKKQFYTRLEKFKKKELSFIEMPELAQSARWIGEKQLAQQIAREYIDGYLLKDNNKTELFTKEALGFMGDFLGDDQSRAFRFFKDYPQKINAVLGDYQAQNKIMNFIYSKYLPQDLKTSKTVNWDHLESVIVSKFGVLGEEITWGQRMMHYLMTGDDWEKYGTYYKLYYQTALKHPRRYYINEMSWAVFEKVSDPEVLKFAIEVMKYDLETYDQNSAAARDTYANLLYKTGKTKEAIQWENEAIKMAKGTAEEESFKEIVVKMKNGQQTWP